MARDFASATADKITLSAAPEFGTATGFTLAYWFNHTSAPGAAFPTRFDIFTCANSAGNTVNLAALHVGSGTDQIIYYYTTAASVFVTIGATVSFTNGQWDHAAICGDYAAATSQIYQNGLAKTVSLISGTEGTPSTTMNSLYFGVHYGGTNDPLNGRLAEIGLWNVKLTAAEIASLSKGFSPQLVRPASLVSYWPLIGRNSPETDIKSGATGTLTGTANYAHPRVIYPKRPKVA